MPKIMYKGIQYSGYSRTVIEPLSIAVLASNWTTVQLGNETYYTQTVSATGVDSTKKPFGFLNLSVPTTEQELLDNRAKIEAYGLISDLVTSTNSVIVYAYGDCPTVDLSLALIEVGSD